MYGRMKLLKGLLRLLLPPLLELDAVLLDPELDLCPWFGRKNGR